MVDDKDIMTFNLNATVSNVSVGIGCLICGETVAMPFNMAEHTHAVVCDECKEAVKFAKELKNLRESSKKDRDT